MSYIAFLNLFFVIVITLGAALLSRNTTVTLATAYLCLWVTTVFWTAYVITHFISKYW